MDKYQLAASKPDSGIHLVLAGAGTGKTATMVSRILKTEYPDNKSPLILTFSRKAADEIKQRLFKKNMSLKNHAFVGTIHSFCYYIISHYTREYTDYFSGSEIPMIISEEEETDLLFSKFKIYKKRLRGIPFSIVRSLYFKYLRDRGIIFSIKNLDIKKELESLYIEFSQDKIRLNLAGFTDLTKKAIELIKNNRTIYKETTGRFSHIFIDEFQDTSMDDFLLIKSITSEDTNIFMVGDDYQSIYGFRGAKPDLIINPHKFFGPVIVHKLINNYRSRKEIIKYAERIIQKNRNRTRKKLTSIKGKGGYVEILSTADRYCECKLIIELVEASANNGSLAILTRTNRQADYLIKKLPVELSPGIQVMTIHRSKGLEFDEVIITGISDDIFPNPLSELEEERRLLYVALTRAREKVTLIHYSDKEIPRFIREVTN